MKKLQRQTRLTAALMMALGLGSAQAAILPGTQTQGVSGEMFMRAYDVDNSVTYALDLGTTVATFLSTIASNDYVWNLGPQFAGFAASATGEIKFNVAGWSMYTNVNLLDPNYGVLVSQLNSEDVTGWDVRDNVITSQLQPNTTGVKDGVSKINLATTTPSTPSTNYAQNLDVIQQATNISPIWQGDNMGIGGNWQGTASVNTGLPDETLNLIWWHGASGPGVTTSARSVWEQQAGYLSLDVVGGTLSWHAVTAVPLPGAAWLFLGGLLGLLRFQVLDRRVAQA